MIYQILLKKYSNTIINDKKAYVHCPYNINFGINSHFLYYKNEILPLLKKCRGFIIHTTKEENIENFIDNIVEAIKISPFKIFFEPPSKGLFSYDFLKLIYEVEKKVSEISLSKNFFGTLNQTSALGLCLDTCHTFSSGISFKNIKKLCLKSKDKIDIIFHLNDSSEPFGSGFDRHANLFTGYISNLDEIINFIIEQEYDVILETPDSEGDLKKYLKGYKKAGITYEINNNNNNNASIKEYLLEESKKEKGFKRKAIESGADIIGNLSIVVNNIEDLNNIKGIGDGIKKRVKEYFEKGYNKEVKVIKRSVIEKYETYFKELFGSDKITIVGSFRRNKEYSSDIDVLILDWDLDEVLDVIRDNIKEIIMKGNKRLSVIVNEDDIQIDFLRTEKENYPFALLYFTGSKNFNINIRKEAIKQGYKLNEYGLFKRNKKVIGLESEKDIFEFLKIQYLKPEERN